LLDILWATKKPLLQTIAPNSEKIMAISTKMSVYLLVYYGYLASLIY